MRKVVMGVRKYSSSVIEGRSLSRSQSLTAKQFSWYASMEETPKTILREGRLLEQVQRLMEVKSLANPMTRCDSWRRRNETFGSYNGAIRRLRFLSQLLFSLGPALETPTGRSEQYGRGECSV